MNQPNRLKPVLKVMLFSASIFAFVIFSPVKTFSQDDYSKSRTKHQHEVYKKHENQLLHACGILGRKRTHIPHKPLLAFHRKYKPNMAERSILQLDQADVTADASTKPQPKVIEKPKPVVKTQPKTEPKIEKISEQKLAELHKKEDEVLADNNLPLPTSSKQQEVRKRVADKLASKTNVYPLKLDPLYFQFNQDEFSVVDMEPFLMAAEYALQGRTVLIEGHTDSRGQDDFNVKLSVKRVQKIRQLMLDMGVPDERISLVGYGEEQSKKTISNEAGHQLNRRVDFTVF